MGEKGRRKVLSW